MLSFAKIHCILDLTKQSQINLYLLKFILTTIETIETISFALPIYIIVEKNVSIASIVVFLFVYQGSRKAPVAVAAAFGRALRYLHVDGMPSGFQVAHADIFRICHCAWTPIGAT